MCNQLRVVKSFQQVLSIAKSFCRELNAKWGLLVSPGDASCMAELAMQWMSTSALKRAYRAGWVQPHGESQTSTFWRMDANHLSLGLKGMPYVKYDEMNRNPPFIFMCLVNVLQSELCSIFQARTPATLRQMSTHVAQFSWPGLKRFPNKNQAQHFCTFGDLRSLRRQPIIFIVCVIPYYPCTSTLFHSVFSKSLAPALVYGGNSQSPVLSVCHEPSQLSVFEL